MLQHMEKIYDSWLRKKTKDNHFMFYKFSNFKTEYSNQTLRKAILARCINHNITKLSTDSTDKKMYSKMKFNVAIRVRASRSKKKYDSNLSNRLFQTFYWSRLL